MFKIQKSSISERCYIVRQTADTWEYLHEDGTIHRSTENENGYMSGWYETTKEAQKVLDHYNENQKPQFKVGDRVRCVKHDAQLVVGNIYTIREVVKEKYSCAKDVIRLNGLDTLYYASYFERVTIKPTYQDGWNEGWKAAINHMKTFLENN